MTPAQFKAARKRLSMSVAEFARFLGVSAHHVRRMERAEGHASHRPVPPRIILRLMELDHEKAATGGPGGGG